MRVRLLPAVFVVTVLAAGCGEVTDAGSNTRLSTTTSTTVYTDVTAAPAADNPATEALVEQAQREVEAAAAAWAAAHPNYEGLLAKAEDIVERFRKEPGFWGVGALADKGIVEVHVDDQTLYDTLIEEFGDDPEVVIRLGPHCVIALNRPIPEGC